jgi:beta-aspartyl-peptidase (threonine type)
MLARTVYGWIEHGMPLQQALQRGIDLIDKDVDTSA